jgi:hypothetical protein
MSRHVLELEVLPWVWLMLCEGGRPLYCIPTLGFEAEGEDGNM